MGILYEMLNRKTAYDWMTSSDRSSLIHEAASEEEKSRMNGFKIAQKCVKRITSRFDYKKNNLPTPSFYNYFEDDDFHKVYEKWASGESKVICICTFKKDEDYKSAFDFINKAFEGSKDHRSALAGKLSLSDKYGSTVDLNFKM